MPTYTVPVIYTTTGHITFEADNMQAAQAKAQRLNEEGVEYFDLSDTESSSEVMIGELEGPPLLFCEDCQAQYEEGDPAHVEHE